MAEKKVLDNMEYNDDVFHIAPENGPHVVYSREGAVSGVLTDRYIHTYCISVKYTLSCLSCIYVCCFILHIIIRHILSCMVVQRLTCSVKINYDTCNYHNITFFSQSVIP